MYYYTKYGSTRLRREYRTMLECGIDCAFLESGQSDIPDEYSAAVRIFNQLGLDATALGERLCRAGRFRAYEHTVAENIGPRGCTANGYRIRSSQTVCATNYPPVREAENPLRYARKTSVVVRGKCSISDGKIAADTGERMYYCADCGYGIRFTRGHILVSGMAHRGAPEEGTVEKLTERFTTLTGRATTLTPPTHSRALERQGAACTSRAAFADGEWCPLLRLRSC